MAITTSFTRVTETEEGFSNISFPLARFSFSSQGDKVLFWTRESSFNSESTNRFNKFYVKDLNTDELILVESENDGTALNNTLSSRPLGDISPDGNSVVFSVRSRDVDRVYEKSLISGELSTVNLPGDAETDIVSSGVLYAQDSETILTSHFDRDTNTNELYAINGETAYQIDTSIDGEPADRFTSSNFVYSNRGLVAFDSLADNLTSDDANLVTDVFVKDLSSGEIIRQSASDNGENANNSVQVIDFSDDGTKLVLSTSATNLISQETDAPSLRHHFVRDLNTGTIIRVDSNSQGEAANSRTRVFAGLSPNGKYALFQSFADNLVENDTNDTLDIFVKNLETGETIRVNESETGEQDNGFANLTNNHYRNEKYNVYFSADSSKVIFSSTGDNLVEGDTNGTTDVFIKDLNTLKIERLTDTDGSEFTSNINHFQFAPDGESIVFNTRDSFSDTDTNGAFDLYIADLDLSVFNDELNISGTQASELLEGGELNDTINGNDGNDTLIGNAGDDELTGGAGDDTFIDVKGSNSIDGGIGTDVIDFSTAQGSAEIDLANPDKNARAAAGNHIINVEHVIGTEFNDTIKGNNADNNIIANDGNDIILGRGGNDVINGSNGNDRIFGQAGNDLLRGGAGDDTLDGGRGNNSFTGGTGRDVFVIKDNTDTTDFIGDFEAGSDVIDLSDFVNYQGGFEGLTFEMFGPDMVRIALPSSQEIFLDNSQIDALTEQDFIFYEDPNAGLGDTLFGTDNDELFFGTEYDDVISGAGGNDTFIASDGFDNYNGGDGQDVADYSAIDGYIKIDLLNQSQNSGAAQGDVFAAIETIRSGTSHDQLKGDNIGNNIDGSDGNDLILGRAGNDTLWGSNGNDTIYGQNGNDVIRGSHDGFTGNDRLDGGAGHDDIDGGAGEDTIISATGEDTLTGGEGADVFVFNTAYDSHSNTGIDVITDFEVDADIIDVSALAIASLANFDVAAPDEIRIVADVDNEQTHIVNDHTGFELILDGNFVETLDETDFIFA